MADVSGAGENSGSRRCGNKRIVRTGEGEHAELVAGRQNQEQRWNRNNRKHTEKKTKNKQLTNTDTHNRHLTDTSPNTHQIKETNTTAREKDWGATPFVNEGKA